MKNTLFALVVLLFVLTPQKAFCWGDEGHSVVALEAQAILQSQSAKDPAAAKALATVQAILGSTTFDKAATWPDEVKNIARGCSTPPYVKDPNYGKDPYKGTSSAICEAYNYTSSWHFINSDSTAYAIDPNAKDYYKGDMVVMINGLSHVLKGEAAPVLDKVFSYASWRTACLGKPSHKDGDCKKEALEYLIHLVGDVHQPLHAGASCDLGANLQEVTFFGQDNDPTAFWCNAKKPKDPNDAKAVHAWTVCAHHELHQSWDVNILVHGPKSAFTNPQVYAASLVKSMASVRQSSDPAKCVSLAPDQAVKIDEPNGPVLWANESLCYQPQVYNFPDSNPNAAKSAKAAKAKREVAQAADAHIANRCRDDKKVVMLDDAGQPAKTRDGIVKVDYFTPFAIGPKYQDANLKTINERLYWGGMRLASLLKDIYGAGDKAQAFDKP